MKSRILWALIPLLLFFSLFAWGVIRGSEYLALTRVLTAQAQSLCEAVALLSTSALANPQEREAVAQLQDDLQRLTQGRGVQLAEVLSPRGEVLASTHPDEIGSRKEDSETRQALGQRVLLTERARWEGQGSILCIVPVRERDSDLGIVRLYLSTQSAADVGRQLNRQLLGMTLILVAAALLFCALMLYWYGNPLLSWAEVADKLAQGQLELRADEHRSDELGLAAQRLNRLASYVQNLLATSQMEASSKKERVQALRSFIDQVLAGDTECQARVEEIDELGQLSMGVNELVRHLRAVNAAGQAIQERLHGAESASCPTIGDLQSSQAALNQSEAPSAPAPTQQFYKNRILPQSETIVAPRPNLPSEPPAAPPAPASPAQGYNFDQAGDLSKSQIAYVNQLSRMGVGQTALVATAGTEDSYPFLRQLLESEGFTVLHASTVAEMLEIASFAAVNLIIVEFNEVDGGNQHAVNRLRNLPQGGDISVMVLETSPKTDVPYASTRGVVQIILPNSDEELVTMIREGLAEILLTGGRNPFVS